MGGAFCRKGGRFEIFGGGPIMIVKGGLGTSRYKISRYYSKGSVRDYELHACQSEISLKQQAGK